MTAELPKQIKIDGVSYVREDAIFETLHGWHIMGVPEREVLDLVRSYRVARRVRSVDEALKIARHALMFGEKP